MTDEQIVALYWSRSEDALTQTRHVHGEGCRRLALRILRDEGAAEECVNDALLRAWNTIPPQQPTHLGAYLLKLTRNLALDGLRTRRAEKRGGGEAEAVLDELAEVLGAAESAESALDAKELGAAVNRFVRALPEREGNVFIRRCFFAESAAEIAQRYGMSEGGVKVSLSRTRKKLKAFLESEGYL